MTTRKFALNDIKGFDLWTCDTVESSYMTITRNSMYPNKK